jgi:hypothetical protein
MDADAICAPPAGPAPTVDLWSVEGGDPLRNVEFLTERIVGHVMHQVSTCKALPAEKIRDDVTVITRTCVELAVATFEGRQSQPKLRLLRDAAARWAREGVPIDTIHHAIHEGVKTMVEQVAPQAADTDIDGLRELGNRLITLLKSLNATVAAAYVKELQRVAGEHHSATHTLATALLGGRPTSAMARECGIKIADSYFVVAVAIAKNPDSRAPVGDTPESRPRRLGRMEPELRRRCGGAMAVLAAEGGTLLVPSEFGDANLDLLVEQLADAVDLPLTAAVVRSPTFNVPSAHAQVHELLDLVESTGRDPGLYRFDDLALEYHITRPGPGRQVLQTALRALDSHPELLDTLRTYLNFACSPKRTARALYIHQNTLQYRLKRIADVVGVDPSTSAGKWYLRAAWTARAANELPQSDQRRHDMVAQDIAMAGGRNRFGHAPDVRDWRSDQ